MLVVTVEDTDAGTRRRCAFLRSPVRLGREPACDLVLDHPYVSARHGLVQFDERGAWYSDLGSRNGTHLGEERLAPSAPVRVGPGVPLRIGPLRLTFEPPQAATAEPRSAAGPPSLLPEGSITALMQRLARIPHYQPGDAWAASLRPGSVVGRFELVRELGRGGFGVVFEAKDRRLGRRVALKALRPAPRSSTQLGEAWLQREAEAVARLSHANIVVLHDAGTWEGGPYLIMELLGGETLAARLERGPLPGDEALRLSIDVARALAHAHGSGVVHRDLKPSNVFVTADGFAKVLDFGLAHVLGGGLDRGGGTPGYMAPEQLLPGPITPAADVFAAAVVLCECLTGERPGAGAAPRLPGAPPSLPGQVARALSARPDDRPGGGQAWLDGLLLAEREAAAGRSGG